MFWGSNYVYGNTFALNGFGPQSVTFYDTNGVPYQTNNVSVWKPAVTTANSTDNFFVNNLFSGNYQDICANVGVAGFVDNRGNLASAMSAALFVDPKRWWSVEPDAARFSFLSRISPAVGAGTWLATITSSSGSGTAFKVDNAGWFFAGLTAAGHIVARRFAIQLQGQTRTATIQSISGNTITFTPSLAWTIGQGVALLL